MERRIAAMVAAVQTVQPPLEKFYGLLNDEQKARLNAIGQDQLKQSTGTRDSAPIVQTCGAAQPAVTQWPAVEVEQKLHPTEAQRASLVALQDAADKAGDMLKISCQPDNDLTPPARLTAAGKRLDTMLQAVKTVSAALTDFYGTLTDEQKAQFEAIGPQQTAQVDQSMDRAPQRHGRGLGGIASVIRHIISIAR
jgi:hypothetical protein